MSALPQPRFFTNSEYLLLEEQSAYKSQFYHGEILAMAGASRRHNLIEMNLAANLHAQLRKKPCEIYQNDMRVKVSDDFYTYPDIVIVCGEPQFERKNGESLLNPTVLIEVLSKSTEQFDRGEKSRQYRSLSSLQEIVLISQDRAQIELWTRQAHGAWLITEITGLSEILKLDSIDCIVSFADIYERVNFNEQESQ